MKPMIKLSKVKFSLTERRVSLSKAVSLRSMTRVDLDFHQRLVNSGIDFERIRHGGYCITILLVAREHDNVEDLILEYIRPYPMRLTLEIDEITDL